MPKYLLYALPVAFFAMVVVVIAYFMASGKDPRRLESVLLDQPVPAFALQALEDETPSLTDADFRGGISIVNVFASWCGPCRAEHPQITELSRDREIAVYGFNYKDKPHDASAWLERFGNPYDRIGVDPSGRVSIDWGVYGVPETFVVDAGGIVRYKHVSVVTRHDLDICFRPLITALKANGGDGSALSKPSGCQ